MNKQPMKSHSESYKHSFAKEVLRTWLYRKPELIGLKNIIRIDIEEMFCMSAWIWFICDLTVYDDTGIVFLIEILNKHKVDNSKLRKMKIYFDKHGYYPELIEVSSNAVLENVDIPEKLYYKKLNYK